MRRVTIKDIAEKTGLSKTSISFAFNSPEKLPQETVKRILDVAAEMGYIPDPIARSMSTGRTGIIGVLLPSPISEMSANPFFNELVRGIGEGCAEMGQTLLLIPPLEGSMSKAVSSAAVDGFLTIGLDRSYRALNVLKQRHIPYIVMDSNMEEHQYFVNIDDRSGAYQAMKHILELGHKDIAVLGFDNPENKHWKDVSGALGRRFQGYNDALKEYGLSLDSNSVTIEESGLSIEAAQEVFLKIWKKKKITAVVASADSMAYGVLGGARKLDLAIPDDLSVIGFDDLPFSAVTNPGLTTIRQPIIQKSVLAIQALNTLIEGKSLKTPLPVLSTELIVRETTKKVG